MPNYALRLFLFIWPCFFMFSAAIDTIRANESLKDSETLISRGNRFKLGFFSPPNSTHRYVGVMFNLPVLTVVWVANRNNPLNDSSGTFELSSDGNLVILDSRKAIVWSTNLSTSVVSSRAELLDTGNLVLQDDESIDDGNVWESFLHASDSHLENMRLFTDLNRNERNMLTSWRSPDDPAPGSFTLTMEPSDIPQVFVRKDGDPYWRTGPWNGQIFTGIPDMRSDFASGVAVVSDSPGTAYNVFTYSNSSALVYAFLNSSGSLEEKIWSDEKKGWEITWSSTSNKCFRYGMCGPFGSCNSDESPICTCLRGFLPKSKDEWDAGNWTSGCTRRTPLQCEHNSSIGKQDEFLKMARVKLPDHYMYLSAKEDCRDACLSSCSCVAFADASGIGCLHWTRNLTDTQKFTNGVHDLYIRLAYSELAEEKQNKRTIIVTAVVLGFILAVVCAYFLLKFLLSYRATGMRKSGLVFPKTKGDDAIYSEKSKLKRDKHGVKFEELHVFQLQQLSNATGNFDSDNKLGQGGFGLVYKGKLPNGVEIAVKRLAMSSNQGVEEFKNEYEVISRLQHRNLVKLVGCCVESGEKMLVYEYMPNGSLDAYLFGSHKHELLDWETRKSIIEGICRGLLYLHRDSRLKVIHRDLKASNILLDEVLNPKISDFGMARIFGGKDNQANTTRVVGTFGYMSPEYALRGIFSEKSDVYSFGVLLLEIVSGKKNSSFHDEDGQMFLTAHAWELWKEGKIVNLVDPTIYEAGLMEDDVVRYANVGLLCVQESAADRPKTCTVLSMLRREIVELPRPKQPAFLGIQSIQGAQSSAESSSKCSLNDVTISIVEGR